MRDLIWDRCRIRIVMIGSADGLDPRACPFTSIRNLSLWKVFVGDCSFIEKYHLDPLLDLRRVGHRMHQQDCAHDPRSRPNVEADVTINGRDLDLGDVSQSDGLRVSGTFVELAAFYLRFLAVPWFVWLGDNRV
jgi:hypothetical protein